MAIRIAQDRRQLRSSGQAFSSAIEMGDVREPMPDRHREHIGEGITKRRLFALSVPVAPFGASLLHAIAHQLEVPTPALKIDLVAAIPGGAVGAIAETAVLQMIVGVVLRLAVRLIGVGADNLAPATAADPPDLFSAG